jgi:hypothetical protein
MGLGLDKEALGCEEIAGELSEAKIEISIGNLSI